MVDRNMRERIKGQKVKERKKKRDRYREKHIDRWKVRQIREKEIKKIFFLIETKYLFI